MGLPKTPLVTVDILIEYRGKIVLIERKNPPAGWAIPGGFVDVGEGAEAAAVREAKEETGLDVTLLAQLKTYSDPSRDPRMHTVSVVFMARGEGELRAGDDAGRAILADEKSLPNPIVFDHGEILKDYFRYRKTGELPKYGPHRSPTFHAA